MDVAKGSQQLTDDCHLLITLNVQLCVQRENQLGVHDAPRRAGPSASAENCLKAYVLFLSELFLPPGTHS